MKSRCNKIDKGLNRQVVLTISEQKNEPGWMTDMRLAALDIFEKKPMPNWGADLSEFDPYNLHYYVNVVEKQCHNWDQVPASIKNTFEALGIPQAERSLLAGVGAQYESEMVYHKLKQEWQDKGVIFLDTDSGLQDHQDIFKRYFATVIPAHDNKFAALNTAVWSGGSFIIVPSGVHVELPLQAYFRMNTQHMGQFERTLIIAQPGSSVHYVEGCSAPLHRSFSLHSAVVELIAMENASIRYTTIQNWSSNVYNLVTKRAIAYKNARVVWIDGNFGSKVTMKYPAVVLKESGSQAQIISIALADKGQHQDTGGKVIHLADNTSSYILAKSISKQTGRSSYRGLVKVAKNAKSVLSRVQCDALMLDNCSRADTYPTVECAQQYADIGHEASVANIDDEQIWYLMTRGIQKAPAYAMMINGFIEPFVKELPMEYAVEINRLIAFDMQGSIG